MARCSRCSTNTINLEAADTNCINTTVTGDGSLATPYVVSSVPIIDPSSSVTCGALGLMGGGGAAHTHDDPLGGVQALVIGGDDEAGPRVPTALDIWTIAIGDFAEANFGPGIAIGSSDTFANRTLSDNEASIAIGSGGVVGPGARTDGDGGIAIGGASAAFLNGAEVLFQSGIAIGCGSVADEDNTAIGHNSNSLGTSNFAVALGDSASANHVSIAIGSGASALSNESISLLGVTSGTDSIAVYGTASTTGDIAIGAFSAANTGTRAIAIGSGTNATAAPLASAQGAIAIGASNGAAILGARSSGAGAIAIGSGTAAAIGASATAASAIAIGRTSSAAHANAVALGDGVSTTNTSQVNIGIKRAFFGCPTTAPAGANLVNSQVSFSTDEAANTLIITVKDSAGTVQTGTVVLV